jgi:hypothetical protein
VPRRDGNKKARLVKFGRTIKTAARLDDYYSRFIEEFIETNLIDFGHLKRLPVIPRFLVKRGGKGGKARSKYRPKDQNSSSNRDNLGHMDRGSRNRGDHPR